MPAHTLVPDLGRLHLLSLTVERDVITRIRERSDKTCRRPKSQ